VEYFLSEGYVGQVRYEAVVFFPEVDCVDDFDDSGPQLAVATSSPSSGANGLIRVAKEDDAVDGLTQRDDEVAEPNNDDALRFLLHSLILLVAGYGDGAFKGTTTGAAHDSTSTQCLDGGAMLADDVGEECVVSA
jgi:hypothetical protein